MKFTSTSTASPRHPQRPLEVNDPFGLSDDVDEEDVPEALHLGLGIGIEHEG